MYIRSTFKGGPVRRIFSVRRQRFTSGYVKKSSHGGALDYHASTDPAIPKVRGRLFVSLFGGDMFRNVRYLEL